MNTKRSLLSLLCYFFTIFFITSQSKELCNKNDKDVLLKIKKSLNNPYHLASWDPHTDCCSWYCLECGGAAVNYRVTELTIFSGNISGEIPPDVGNLPFLRTLVFRKLTNLTGTIQPTIAKLENLQTLRLSWTNLSGPVPDFLGRLKNLQFLDLSFNDLSGSIPSSLSLLPNLLSLDLSRNKLTGSIPESFGSFHGKVPDLYLSHNQLSGVIPKSLGNLDINRIDFSRNKLQGDASFLFGVNKSTWYIDLSRNMLEFDLSKVIFPKTLGVLDLNHNKIAGSIPVQLTEVPLQFFNVSYNRLCGSIPTGGTLQKFDYSTYVHNRCLCGAPLESCK